MRGVASVVFLLACCGTSAAEFLPADDWLVCWRPAIEVEARQLLRGFDASAHRAELRGRLWQSWHGRLRATTLNAASLEQRALQLALRWRAPWLELQAEGELERGELPGLPTQLGRSVGACAAVVLSRWRWGVRIRQRRRDVPESARFQFALRHRRGSSVIVLRRETRPFAGEQRWEFAAATALGSVLRVAVSAAGESLELRWRLQRSKLALSGGLPLWSELDFGPSLAVEWSLP